MRKIISAFNIVLFVSLSAYGNNFEWWAKLSKIKPLQTTKKEVEGILGKPTNTAGKTIFYEIGEDKVGVEYSDGLCDEYDKGNWNAPEETVLNYSFDLIRAGNNFPALYKFAKFAKFNLQDFQLDAPEDLDDVDTPTMIPYNYNNEKLGIFLQGFNRGKDTKKGKISAGKITYLRGIRLEPAENAKFPKCS